MTMQIPPSGSHGARMPGGSVLRFGSRMMAAIYRLTGGRSSGEMLLLTTVGAKSGEQRVANLRRFDDGVGISCDETTSLSDAHAEFSRTPVDPENKPVPAQRAPAPAAADAADSQPPAANMMAPATATRWPDPMPAAGPGAGAPAAAAVQAEDVRPAAVVAATTPPQVMPRAVPPVPASEKPLSLPMLITIVAGGLSVLGVIFAAAADDKNTGFALTAAEAAPVAREGLTRTRGVSTDDCA